MEQSGVESKWPRGPVGRASGAVVIVADDHQRFYLSPVRSGPLGVTSTFSTTLDWPP
jgi:hypothetical protein